MYGWERNVGYATPDHITGLAAHGITPHHRRSFFRVSQLTLDLDSPVSSMMWASGEGPIPGAGLEIVFADVARGADDYRVGDFAEPSDLPAATPSTSRAGAS